MKYYICHYKPNISRRDYILEHFAGAGRSVEWLTAFDREEITDELSTAYAFKEESFSKMVAPQMHILIGNVIGLSPGNSGYAWSACFEYASRMIASSDPRISAMGFLKPSPLSSGNISLNLKHLQAWKKIAEGSESYACVLEDDFMLKPDSLARLDALIGHLPQACDYIDLAGGCGFHCREEEEVSPGLRRLSVARTRTTCAYLISRDLCRRISALDVCPSAVAIDWMLNNIFTRINCAVYWTEPEIFLHGSEITRSSNLR